MRLPHVRLQQKPHDLAGHTLYDITRPIRAVVRSGEVRARKRAQDNKQQKQINKAGAKKRSGGKSSIEKMACSITLDVRHGHTHREMNDMVEQIDTQTRTKNQEEREKEKEKRERREGGGGAKVQTTRRQQERKGDFSSFSQLKKTKKGQKDRRGKKERKIDR